MNTLPEEKQLLEEIEAHADVFADAFTTPEQYIETLQSNLKSLKGVKEKLIARKEEITKPLRIALESARNLFRPAEEKLASVEANLKAEILETEKKREKEQEKLMSKIEKGRVSPDQGLSLMSKAPKGLFRPVKVMEIKNKKLIPDKYWVIDEVAVRAALIAGKKVPGAILVEKKTVVSR